MNRPIHKWDPDLGERGISFLNQSNGKVKQNQYNPDNFRQSVENCCIKSYSWVSVSYMEIMLQKALLTWGMYFYFTLHSYKTPDFWPNSSNRHTICFFLTSRWLYEVLVSKDWLMTSQISLIGYVCVYIVNHKFPWIYSRFDSWIFGFTPRKLIKLIIKAEKGNVSKFNRTTCYLNNMILDSHRYKLMLQCWDQEPSRRPTFESITSWMENLAHPHCTESRNTSQIIS